MKQELYIAIRDSLKELIRGTEFEGKVLCVGGCVRDEIMAISWHMHAWDFRSNLPI